jgi:anti-sigma B factor antagonist
MTLQEAPRPEPFEVAVWQRDRHSVTMVLSGELDLSSAPKLRECLAELAALDVIHMVIDLANLRFIDSTGVSVLVADLKRVSAAGGSLSVRNANPMAVRIFDTTGLTGILSVTAAEGSVPPAA